MFLRNSFNFVAFTIAFSVGLVHSFPSNIQQCRKGDLNCITEVMNSIFRNNANGSPEIGLIPLDPLAAGKIYIDYNLDGRQNFLNFHFEDAHVLGLKEAEIVEVKGFGENPNGKHEFRYKTPIINTTGKYNIRGKWQALSIYGDGIASAIIRNVDSISTFTGKSYVKNGKIYMKVENFQIRLRQKGGQFAFNGLFNGNQELNDAVEDALNQEFDEIYRTIIHSVEKAYVPIATKVVNEVFASTPYDELFIRE